MQVICTDGTVFACQSYELTEYGVICYEGRAEGERYEGDPEQVGYVPHDRLWYVLPDGVVPNVVGVGPEGAGPQPGHLEQRGQRPGGASGVGGVKGARSGGPTRGQGGPALASDEVGRGGTDGAPGGGQPDGGQPGR